MKEPDDRLVGDPVWELFSSAPVTPARGFPSVRACGRWLAVASLVAVFWFLLPPLAVVIACVAVAVPDLRAGRQLARSIPDKAGGIVCARFTYAWGAWKFGWAALAMTFVSVFSFSSAEKVEASPALLVATLLWFGGFIASAALTAWGLLGAYRSGMRVWIGQGVNQARTLLLGMLIVAFSLLVLLPICVGISEQIPRASDARPNPFLSLALFVGCWFAGPVVILVILDRVSRRVIADRPAKFGPKVPAVGKW